jgi:short-subunit dehydrogenase
VTHALLPKLLQSPRPFIVNVSSLAGLLAAPGMCAYATSKAGIVGFSSSLALEFEGRVGVATICPSFVKTDIAQHALLSEGAVEAGRAETAGAMNAFLSVVGTNPRKVSAAVIRAVKKNKRLVLVNPDAYMLYYLHRFLPWLGDALVARVYRRLLKAFLIHS